MTHIEHQEAMMEMEQNRAFEILDRQERLENIRAANKLSNAAADLNLGMGELNRAKARFWRTGAILLVSTWWLVCGAAIDWFIHHLH